jgi:hypothetical protein
MDTALPAGITHRAVEVVGLRLHLGEAGPADGPSCSGREWRSTPQPPRRGARRPIFAASLPGCGHWTQQAVPCRSAA